MSQTDNRKTAEEKIAGFLKFGSRLGLERMTVLMDKLGNPQYDYDVIHIAGTNGKGSCARYIYETLLSAGYKTGIYTSPYLERFNERIEFCREKISDADLEECTDAVLSKVDEMVSEGCDSPTEFEVVTAVCFLYFSRKKCDVAVLEVGLGGRGDSTNIVKKPLVSVITSISYDHMDRLGDTIPEIAGEKAGIIKEGCPVVVSTERGEALQVFRDKAAEMKTDLIDARELTQMNVISEEPTGSVFDILFKDGREYKNLSVSMGGPHQVTNAAEAVVALDLLRGKLDISEDDIRAGLKNAVQPGRFEVLYKPEKEKEPWVIIDGAHNSDGTKKLREAMGLYFSGKSVLTVMGILADKDVSGMLDEITAFSTDLIATEPDNERKLRAYDLAKEIHERGRMVYEIPKPEDAAALAMSIGKGYDVVLFSGSLYLIGRIRTILKSHYLRQGDICFSREDEEDSFTVGVAEEEEDD